MFECLTCGKGPSNGVSVYRQNPKGETGVWACIDHAQPNPEIEEMVQEVKDVLRGYTPLPKDMKIIG